MPATAWPPNRIEIAWGALAVACLATMIAWPSWETIPFHVIWITLTLLYGFRGWSPAVTGIVLGAVIVGTGASILADAFNGLQLWGELFEVPLMSAMFLAMVWHARRRQDSLREMTSLLARIRVRLSGAAAFGDRHVLRGGTVVLDVARRQARVGERSADLSDREFRLLHHLLVHAGEVVSRERLLAEVWGYDFDPGSNVVDVCVRRLRQKLGPDAAIETVRHAGYRLAAA